MQAWELEVRIAPLCRQLWTRECGLDYGQAGLPASSPQDRPGLSTEGNLGLQSSPPAWPDKRRIVASYFQVMAVKREGSEQDSGTRDKGPPRLQVAIAPSPSSPAVGSGQKVRWKLSLILSILTYLCNFLNAGIS